MNITDIVILVTEFLWGWPLIIGISATSVILTIILGGVQFKYFLASVRSVFSPSKTVEVTSGDMSPFQAFINALSASLGNGTIAGMATALAAGGPGAALWVALLGPFVMALRFCEVYLSVRFGGKQSPAGMVGGPMVYLSHVPGGSFLPYLYAFFCFLLTLSGGSAAQANSIRLGLTRTLGISPLAVALLLFCFVLYIMIGGARRIIAVSDMIVPVKVGVFSVSTIIALIYHAPALPGAFMSIVYAAFGLKAFGAGVLGYSIKEAVRYGMSRSLNASEAGLGTAAVLFGGTRGGKPIHSAIMGMLGTFISADLMCFSLMLLIVASGALSTGQTSVNLTISAYETVFGTFGSWIVTFLTISFGLGVLVAYAYISRACWLFLTNGRMVVVCSVIFALATLFGALADVELVWKLGDLANAGLLISNLYALLYFAFDIRRALKQYETAGSNE